MSTSDKLQTFLPIFDWNWWQLFGLFLVVDWGILLAIKYFEPLGWHRAYWKSAIYGDIFLPIGIASAIIVSQQANLGPAWYTSRWWNWLVLITGIVLILAIEVYLAHPKNGHYTWSQIIKPSKLWHTLIFPFMFYAAAITLIPLIIGHSPLWAVVLSIVGYGGWLALYISDLIWPPDFSKTH